MPSSGEGAHIDKKSVAVVSYIHCLSHHLKEIAQGADINVGFSALHKLGSPRRITQKKSQKICEKQRTNKYVECHACVIYRIPLSCGSDYVGQTY